MICPKAKSATHCLTELFSIYQNKHGTIRRRDDHVVVQSSYRNIFKIDWFLLYHTFAAFPSRQHISKEKMHDWTKFCPNFILNLSYHVLISMLNRTESVFCPNLCREYYFWSIIQISEEKIHDRSIITTRQIFQSTRQLRHCFWLMRQTMYSTQV